MKTILDIIFDRSAKEPERVVFVAANESIQYKRFAEMIDTTAYNLQSYGIKSNEVVSVSITEPLEYICCLFALCRLGAIVNPVNSSLKKGDISNILHTVKPSFVVTDQETEVFEEIYKPENHSLPFCIRYQLLNTHIRPLDGKGIPFPRDYETMGCYLSSGSTGAPKCIYLTNEALTTAASLSAEQFNFTDQDLIITALPLTHLYGGNTILAAGILSGAAMMFEESFQYNKILEKMKEYKTTVFAGVPTMFEYLNKHAKFSAESYNFPQLKMAISAGAMLSQQTSAEFNHYFGIPIINHYGLTEAAGFISANDPLRFKEANCIGIPSEKFHIKIVNDQNEDVQDCEIGELLIKADHLQPAAKGLYSNSETPWFEDGFLRTGDIVKRGAEGELYIVGRAKEIILTGGYVVNPFEVEEYIKLLDYVSECVVFPAYDELMGEIPVAAVVLEANTRLGNEEITKHCIKGLISYKCPQRIIFLSELPRTSTGKIKRQELIRQYGQFQMR